MQTTTESNTYRRALIRLYCMATWGERKTLDKAEVARIAGEAIDRGNEIHRAGKVGPLKGEND